MTERRALLTDREREIITGDADVKDAYRYQTISRVRSRFDRLEDDLEVFEQHGDLADELREIVCRQDVTEGRETPVATPEPVDDLPPVEETRPATPAEERRDMDDLEPADDVGPDVIVQDVVDAIATSWSDTPERLEARKTAAEAALQHAVETGDAVGKSDAVDQFLDEYAVEGQNDETWWRKNVRDVLQAVGDYSPGKHGYVVTEDALEAFLEDDE